MMIRTYVCRSRLSLLLAGCVVALALAGPSSASAEPAGPGWAIRSTARPTSFSPGATDSYSLNVTNVGGAASDGSTVVVRDTLPSDLEAVSVEARDLRKTEFEEENAEHQVTCTTAPLECTYAESVPAGDSLQIVVGVVVKDGERASVTNRA